MPQNKHFHNIGMSYTVEKKQLKIIFETELNDGNING